VKSEQIRERRKELNLTQDELAKKIGVSKRTIINYEKGEVIPETKAEILHNVLYGTDETKARLKDHNTIAVNYSELQVMYVPLVNQYAYAGYMNGYGDSEYIENLPRIPWADDIEHRGDYLCFEAKGDSMDDGTDQAIKDGDILLCRNVRKDYWKSKLHINQWDFVIVHPERGIVTKRIIKHDVDIGMITLHSLNELYEDYTVDLREITQILNIVDIKRRRKR